MGDLNWMKVYGRFKVDASFDFYWQPSGRARLGEKALKCLSQGKAVDDEILVDIIVEAIR